MFKKNKNLYADLSLLLVALIWGSGFVATKHALNTITPYYMMTFRFTIACLLMAIVFYKRLKSAKFQDFKAGTVIGLFLFVAFAAQTVGLQYTTAGKQAFLTGTNVVIVPFLYWIVKKNRPDKYNLTAAFLCFCGIGLLTLSESLSINLGDLLTLVCAFFFACHIVSIGYFAEHHDPIVLTIVQLGISAVLSFAASLLLETAPQNVPTDTILAVLYLGVFSTLVAFLIQNVAQKYTTPTHAAIILSLESVFGTILSTILLKELFTVKMFFGCVIIFVAILTAETKWEFLKMKKVRENS
ncbi:drug/metabolite transporter (DMT)-like permease [Anaerosolibacter carboniphilus]|uniref:Drug/metabolite transporter (DMT)-like permease n=1 Tax=Anaerosolibacter carboniphilus TaxID=1417629 RepID=A0A841KYT9_9FIRM|nr:DMT family transporter [Anaerosolibacter carboniphilus]MBB6215295.1 drug/metabolite transporter (DMT)-like permease [Anaerosolibacter carboniphilus]